MLRWVLIAMAGGALFVSSGAAADTPNPKDAAPYPPVRDAIFVRNWTLPTYDQLGPVGPYYPERAAREGVQGFALIDCMLAANGRLSQCAIRAQMPEDAEFGAAALVMARRGVVQALPRKVDGHAVASEDVVVQVPFRLGRQ